MVSLPKDAELSYCVTKIRLIKVSKTMQSSKCHQIKISKLMTNFQLHSLEDLTYRTTFPAITLSWEKLWDQTPAPLQTVEMQ